MKKLILVLSFLLSCAVAFAQEPGPSGGVEASVVARVGRIPVPFARVRLTRGQEVAASVVADSRGAFRITGVESGAYVLTAEADGYNPASVNVVIEGYVRNLIYIMLSPSEDALRAAPEDTEFADFDMEDSGYDDNPTLLFSGNDPSISIAGFGFSAISFIIRGYASETQSVLLSGVELNDALTGYSPYSLWSGLNEAMRSKETGNGLESSSDAAGGYNGVTNIIGTPSSVRPGLRFSVLSNSAMYRLRLMGTYASGQLDDGWSYAVSVSARLGGNDWVQGVYYRSFAYYAGVEKQIGDRHRIGFFTFASPGERGAQNASTQEVYDLMGDNMYNSNWGYQNGRVRNARVRKTFEPVTVLKHSFTPSERLSLHTTLLWRTGRNGYTALDWYDAMDPRPDYYRNLPSYAYMEDEDYNRSNIDKADWLRESWALHIPAYYNYQHINWDRLYNVNYTSEGGRSKYVQEERHVDQNDINLAQTLNWVAGSNFSLDGGWKLRWNRTEYYKKIADLLGGEYYLDVDSFAERDFGVDEIKLQNDLDYYLAHGEARKVRVGDKYGYDYLAYVTKAGAWADGRYSAGALNMNLTGTAGYESFYRVGLTRKGLFPEDSKGRSDVAGFPVWSLKGGASYDFAGGRRLSASAGYFTQAPTFSQAFVSPRTRNTLVEDLKAVKVFSADLNYRMSRSGYNVRGTVFYTYIKDQSDLMSFYDDSQHSFTNFSMTGIDQRHMGVEFGASVPLPVKGLSLGAALSFGEYIYTSTPRMVQTIDNSAEVVRMEEVPYWQSHPVFRRTGGEIDYDFSDNPIVDHYEKHYVPSSPQFASELLLAYRTDSYWFFELNGQYFDRSYLNMNPIFRTTFALKGSDKDPSVIEDMCSQEKFDAAFLLNFSAGKSWYIRRTYNLGFSLSVNNILDNRSVKTGGFEQTRLITSAEKSRYYRFDSKYFYMPGFNYMLNIYFRF